MSTLIKNVTLVYPTEVVPDSYVLFDTSIAALGSMSQVPLCEHTIDGTGLILTPGFIDNHIHGCGGADTMDGADAVRTMAALLPRGGTTSFCATTVAAYPADLSRALQGVREAMADDTVVGANVLGAHVEGPFLCPAYKGAHEEACLTAPDFALIQPYTDVVRVVTLAPELPGGESFIRTCAAAGIVCSIGHTAATFEACLTALSWGAKSFTHTYNAMTPLNHRNPGTVGALLTQKIAFAEMICDNIHVHPAAQAVVFREKGCERLLLITDALRPCMKGDGPFMLGNLTGEVKNGQARLLDGTLAGSVLTLNEAVSNLMENTGCTLQEAVCSATLTPAALLGLKSKGQLTVGFDADLTVLTPDFSVQSTFVAGQEVYHA